MKIAQIWRRKKRSKFARNFEYCRKEFEPLWTYSIIPKSLLTSEGRPFIFFQSWDSMLVVRGTAYHMYIISCQKITKPPCCVTAVFFCSARDIGHAVLVQMRSVHGEIQFSNPIWKDEKQDKICTHTKEQVYNRGAGAGAGAGTTIRKCPSLFASYTTPSTIFFFYSFV